MWLRAGFQFVDSLEQHTAARHAQFSVVTSSLVGRKIKIKLVTINSHKIQSVVTKIAMSPTRSAKSTLGKGL